MTTHTPWGPTQHQEQHAPGITFHSTAGHGGFKLSADRLASMPPELRGICPFAGEGWYEEDADWSIVALAFPDGFSDLQLWQAWKTAGWASWKAAADRYLMGDGRPVFDRISRWASEHAGWWTYTGGGTSGSGWVVRYQRIDGTESRTVRMANADWPSLVSPDRILDFEAAA